MSGNTVRVLENSMNPSHHLSNFRGKVIFACPVVKRKTDDDLEVPDFKVSAVVA